LGVIPLPAEPKAQQLTRAIVKFRAMYMKLMGEFMNAQEAYAGGLLEPKKLFEDDALVEEAMTIAKTIPS
jgi:enoyl-CoA hydratase/carnithine racemase